jgi:alpha-tubulin suppressor-like RCC1 family protein
VDLGTGKTAVAVAAGYTYTCALLNDATIKCWGGGGELGLGDSRNRGDQPGEMGDHLPAVDLGTNETALGVSAGYGNACALLPGGRVKCWGLNYDGQLGLGDTTTRGDAPGQMGDSLPAVNLGSCWTTTAVSLGTGAGDGEVHACALLNDGTVKCWGAASELGLGDLFNPHGSGPGQMGDNLPAVKLFSSEW